MNFHISVARTGAMRSGSTRSGLQIFAAIVSLFSSMAIPRPSTSSTPTALTTYTALTFSVCQKSSRVNKSR